MAWGWLSIRSLLVLGLVEYKNFTWPGVELYLAWGRSLLGQEMILCKSFTWPVVVVALLGLGLVVYKSFTWPGVGCG